ncbi:uncharacterized protein LOC103579404 [Microplitis demolitor]|uniref:uncharacterized protein LOC103579404 n=1 Tax=Microplitis demolitor TaxID=69319 RepID=UPI0004CD00E8|nr:uncharacterized protein LOC103579404 [Microplitis demolitor]
MKMVFCKLNCNLVIALMLAGLLTIEARPQQNDYEDLYPVDGFSFDGPADRTNPNFNDVNNVRPPRPVTSTNSPSSVSTTMSPAMTTCTQNCLATSEFNPVCGTDGVVYSNPGRLGCARRCGKDVSFSYYGPCTTSPARG